jgi:hypothetical protein
MGTCGKFETAELCNPEVMMINKIVQGLWKDLSSQSEQKTANLSCYSIRNFQGKKRLF